MSESLDQPIEVPELTADEIQARVLHRDGLMLVIDKPAVTKWKVLGRSFGVNLSSTARADPPPRPSRAREEGATQLTWLALEPVTGRTHQLRVHASAQGWPIVGDNIYGNGPRFGEPRLHLHSRELVVPISRNKDPVRVIAPAPSHMHERLRACGWNGE